MKRLSTILFLGICLQSTAQENWAVMPNIGLNLTQIELDEPTGNAMKSGLSLGLEFSQRMEDHIHMNYGLSVNRRFLTYSSSSESDELENLLNIGNLPVFNTFDLTIYENTVGYSKYWTLDLPITISYTFDNGLMLFAGGYVNYLMNVNSDETTTTHIPIFEVVDPNDLPFVDATLTPFLPKNGTESRSDNTKGRFNDIGYGVIGGIGYESNNVVIRANFQYGLNDIMDDEDVKINLNKQRAIQLGVGYKFGIKPGEAKDKKRYDLKLIE